MDECRFTKLAGLLIKTLAKPLSKQIKHQVSRYPAGQRLLIGIGQSTHAITSRLTIWAAGYRVRSITPLEEEKALKEGAEFMGESFLFLISGSWLLYEYNNAQEKARAKELAHRLKTKAERDELRTQLHAIDVRLQALETALQNQWGILMSTSYQPPPEKTRVKIAAPLSPDDDDDDEDKEKKRDGSDAGGKDKAITSASSNASKPPLQQQQSQPNARGWLRWIWPF